MMLLTVRNIKKNFIEKKVLKDISFDITDGERIGIVGLNGAGKTTLVNIITGNLPYDDGSIMWHKKSVNIGYLRQDGAYTKNINNDERCDFLKYSSRLKLDKVYKWNEDKLNNLSGGERTKLALSKIWSKNPDFLILDEPTNHLDYEGIKWLIKEINTYRGTVIIISHDRYFLDKCVNKIMEIDDGKINEYNGNYSFYREEKKRRYESQLNRYLIQEETKRKINEQINTLKNWSLKAHRDSRKKALSTGSSMGVKEYFRAKAKKKDIQIKSRIKRLEKIKVEGIEKPEEEKKIDFNFKDANLKGTRVIEVNNISKSFNDKVLFKDSSFYIQRSERVGVFGNNGCGKTTLLKILLGVEKLDSGEIFLSNNSKVGYLSQSVEGIDMEKQVLDIFDFDSRDERGKIQTILYDMGFDEKMINQPVKTLSLGEITRLRIVKLIIDDFDLLILDEPLNHLDIFSREKLEEVLENYNGTIIVVSHDYYMLKRICSKLLVFEDKKIKRVEQTIDEYLENKNSNNNKNAMEEKMLIDNEIAFILGEIDKYSKDSSEYKKLDERYKILAARKRELV